MILGNLFYVLLKIKAHDTEELKKILCAENRIVWKDKNCPIGNSMLWSKIIVISLPVYLIILTCPQTIHNRTFILYSSSAYKMHQHQTYNADCKSFPCLRASGQGNWDAYFWQPILVYQRKIHWKLSIFQNYNL